MVADAAAVRKTSVALADGRELLYFGNVPARPADYPDRRQLTATGYSSQARWDWLRGEWVIIATHRQDRTFRPAPDQCPLCPSTSTQRTEIPAPEYDVVVFENRFPSLRGDARVAAVACWPRVPAGGRCEVVCFSQHHDASFADLSPAEAATVHGGLDRPVRRARRGTRRRPGVLLREPRRRDRRDAVAPARPDLRLPVRHAAHRPDAGVLRQLPARNRAEPLRRPGRRRARGGASGSCWPASTGSAFVPHAAHWPYEVHLYPRRRVPDLPALDGAQRAEFCELYLDLLRRFDRLFDPPGPVHLGLASGAGPRRGAPASRCTWSCSPSGGRPASSSTWPAPSRAWARSRTTSRPRPRRARLRELG